MCVNLRGPTDLLFCRRKTVCGDFVLMHCVGSSLFHRERPHSWTGPSCLTQETSVPARDTNVVSDASSDPITDHRSS